MNIVEELRQNLFLEEYPRYFDLKNIDFNFPHTHLQEKVIDAIFKNIDCDFYLEIGTMHGGSAIAVAEYIKKNNLKTKIVCIDPFCGDVNMWAWEKGNKLNNKWNYLNLKNGRPQIYETFLSNIKYTNNENNIIPICATSSIGTHLIQRLYKENRISKLPNIIYLDSAHIEGETYFELQKAYSLLTKGGILYGDDFGWRAVKNDVLKFIETIQINQELTYSIKENLGIEEVILGKLLVYRRHWLICK